MDPGWFLFHLHQATFFVVSVVSWDPFAAVPMCPKRFTSFVSHIPVDSGIPCRKTQHISAQGRWFGQDPENMSFQFGGWASTLPETNSKFALENEWLEDEWTLIGSK